MVCHWNWGCLMSPNAALWRRWGPSELPLKNGHAKPDETGKNEACGRYKDSFFLHLVFFNLLFACVLSVGYQSNHPNGKAWDKHAAYSTYSQETFLPQIVQLLLQMFVIKMCLKICRPSRIIWWPFYCYICQMQASLMFWQMRLVLSCCVPWIFPGEEDGRTVWLRTCKRLGLCQWPTKPDVDKRSEQARCLFVRWKCFAWKWMVERGSEKNIPEVSFHFVALYFFVFFGKAGGWAFCSKQPPW